MSKRVTLGAIILGLSFILGCFILGSKWVDARQNSRYVTVKGLSEREVRADRAWYSINCQYGANSSEEVQTRIGWIENEAKAYLKSFGFRDEDIGIEGISVQANNYQGANSRFTADVRISVSSTEIEKVQEASKSISRLIAKGILIQSDKWAAGPKYYFTEFTTVKTEMLAEATREARKAAEQFAINSDSRVGDIRRANQGVFQILPGNRTGEDQVFYPDKIIRVVSTVDYILE